MDLPKTITSEWLEEHGVCDVGDFDRVFPHGARLTAHNIFKAAGAGLDLEWFACTMLSGDARAAYHSAVASARAAYHSAVARVWAAYDAAVAPAQAAYDAAVASARAAYHSAVARAWAAYDAAVASARAAYHSAVARALIVALGL